MSTGAAEAASVGGASAATHRVPRETSSPVSAGSGSPRDRGFLLIIGLLVGGVALLAVGALDLMKPQAAAGLVIGATVGVVSRHWLLHWPRMVAALVLVILFIPIRRYGFIGDLPFQLEPYRVFMAILIGAWLSGVLIERSITLRRSVFDKPVIGIFIVTLASIVMNPARVGETGGYVAKAMMFLISFLLVYAIIVSVIRERSQIDMLIRLFCIGGVVLGLTAILEARGIGNPFDHLQGWIPGLSLQELPDVPARNGRARAYASAQHPISLSALLAMIIPLMIYMARRTGHARWMWLIAFPLAGIAATSSRTGILMVCVVIAVFAWLRPKQARRFSPLLIPGLVLVQLTMPGTLGSLYKSFFPESGLIAEQANAQVGSGRVASFGPAISEWSETPLFGQGYGTRVTDEGPDQNAFILDDQWLSTLLDSGLLGALAWAWLFGTVVVKLGLAARRDDTDDGWLMASLSAAIAAFAVGMVTFDAFSFIQVTFVAFALIGIGAVVYRMSGHEDGTAVTETRETGAA